jgi:endonuclease G
MKADLSRKVDVAGMRSLSISPENSDGMLESVTEAPPGTEWREIEVGLEAAGAKQKKIRVLVTKPETFADRTGYDAAFIDGWEIPFPAPGSADDVRPPRRGGNDGSTLHYEHFSTLQSRSRRMPLVVAVNIDGNKEKKITRTSTPWRFDGRLDVEDQIGDEVYAEKKNVLDRGHMVRREDPIWGPPKIAGRANVDTFHFTNSCPQMATVNQQIWLGLENYILHNTRDEDLAVSVFTGPVFRKNDLKYRGALIPKSFFKVVAVVDDDGRPSATGYEVSQEDELSELEFVFGPYKTFQTSIKAIEEKTGLSFGDLKEYDGFSVSEKKGGGRKRVELESLEMVRI